MCFVKKIRKKKQKNNKKIIYNNRNFSVVMETYACNNVII